MGLTKLKLKNRLLKMRLRNKDLHRLTKLQLHALDGLDDKMPISQCRFVTLDLETTGLDTANDRVVSVGAVRIADGQVHLGDHFNRLINPGRDIPVESIKVHGIVPDDLADAPPAWEVFGDFLDYLGGDILVAHYAKFDLWFINRVMRAQHGFPIQNLVLDTVVMCQGVVLPSDPYGIERDKQRCSIESLSQRFGLEIPDRHTALGDALATAMIFQVMVSRLAKSGGTRLRDLIRVAVEH